MSEIDECMTQNGLGQWQRRLSVIMGEDVKLKVICDKQGQLWKCVGMRSRARRVAHSLMTVVEWARYESARRADEGK